MVGCNVDDMMELRADSAGVFDAVRPCDHKRIPRSAKMRRDLFAPLEGRVHGPRPAHRDMIGRLGAAQFVDVPN
jgi:hypothetical protein